MFWDDIKLVTEQVQKYGLRKPFVDLGGLEKPTIADYDLTIKTGDQSARYVGLRQRPFDHIDPSYLILNPEKGDPAIEALPQKYINFFGTAVCLNVIEHIENPLEVFRAFYEIMKPNSLLVISTVFLFPYHPSPRDYWRYSPEGLRFLSKEAGFTVLECDWRLSIPASAGILDIHTLKPQEIISVFVTLTKGEFAPTTEVTYPLPQRESRNEIANRLIEIEKVVAKISNCVEQTPTSLDSDSTIAGLQKSRRQIADLLLNMPAEHLPNVYLGELANISQKLVSSAIKEQPLTETEIIFVEEILEQQRQCYSLPEWEYIPQKWAKNNLKIKGWNVESILEIRKANWSRFRELLQMAQPVANNHGTHNTYMAYAYVLALTAQRKERISILDWGGGLGEYYLLSKALLPDLEIDYHCKEVSVLCEAGRELLPEAKFYDDDSECFEQSYDLVVASSSLQYSENWQGVVSQLEAVSRSYLYITRLPIVHKAASFVVLQRPYQYGYGTEYLGWFLNRGEFLNYMNRGQMELVREFIMAEGFPVPGAPEPGEGRGFLFRPRGTEK
ncbi:methyltransferase, TIGR04325 family [Microcoleus sp. S28C3]|uniref:methyltransferase, TIGR04325 family n=1 Tax=Microcoleus sp. S28C3 TaxID=3055414 RepID=UPI002FD18747